MTKIVIHQALRKAGLTEQMLAEISKTAAIDAGEALKKLADAGLEPPITAETAEAALLSGSGSPAKPNGGTDKFASMAATAPAAPEDPGTDVFAAAAEAALADPTGVHSRPTPIKRPKRVQAKTRVKGFFHAHPTLELPALWVYEYGYEGGSEDPHLVAPDLVEPIRMEPPNVAKHLSLYDPFLVCTTAQVPILFLVKRSQTGRMPSATRDKLQAIQDAKHEWLELVWDMESRQYLTFPAESQGREPEWPDDLSLPSLLRSAFDQMLIDSIEHALLDLARGRSV